MLNEGTVFATVAVSSLEKSKEFYGTTLGLRKDEENPGGVMFASGTGKLFIYESPNAGTNQATCASWKVNDVEGCVSDLAGKGVVFEHYDMPGGTRDGDVHSMGDMKAAWFKDPDGNILGINN